jgi:hypothetical protein
MENLHHLIVVFIKTFRINPKVEAKQKAQGEKTLNP